MMTFEDEANDIFYHTTSHGTTPLDSTDEHDTNIVYKINSDDSNSNTSDEPNIIPEELAESEQAELSMQTSFHYSTLLTCYVQIALQKIGYL